MKRLTVLPMVGLMAVVLAGCSGFFPQPTTNPSTGTPSASASPPEFDRHVDVTYPAKDSVQRLKDSILEAQNNDPAARVLNAPYVCALSAAELKHEDPVYVVGNALEILRSEQDTASKLNAMKIIRPQFERIELGANHGELEHVAVLSAMFTEAVYQLEHDYIPVMDEAVIGRELFELHKYCFSKRLKL